MDVVETFGMQSFPRVNFEPRLDNYCFKAKIGGIFSPSCSPQLNQGVAAYIGGKSEAL